VVGAPDFDQRLPQEGLHQGNRRDEWIYHLPTGDPFYKVTNPEECFASEDGAKKAGYRAALV
jgi:hypothetical protein